jgi:hypothetical protein
MIGHSHDRRGRPAWRFTQAADGNSGSGPRRESAPAMGPTDPTPRINTSWRHSPVEPPRLASSSRTFAGAAIEIGNLRTGGAHPSIPCMPPGDPHNGTTPLPAGLRALPMLSIGFASPPGTSAAAVRDRLSRTGLSNRPTSGSLSADQCRSIGCTSTLWDRDQIEAHRSAAS